jgi:hypothetical protein
MALASRACQGVFAGKTDEGKKPWISRNFTGSKREAQAALNKLIAQVEAGQGKPHAGSLGDLLDRWLDDIDPNRSRYTIRSSTVASPPPPSAATTPSYPHH